MKKLSLKLDDLRVDTFETATLRGGVESMETDGITVCSHCAGCGTFSLNEGTQCFCSAPAPVCSQNCVEVSQFTDFQACCG
ncbi:MAG TPA: hypothetical protein VGO40_23950 [Longimicrobium sp.]|jgi:hypothetical protein|nr:hypothetical protein [Longimicrobium sp.]